MFQKYVYKLEQLCDRYMEVMLAELREMCVERLIGYVQMDEASWWWSRHDVRRHAVESSATPSLSRCLPFFQRCRTALRMQLNHDLFDVLWWRLTEHVDRVVYEGVVRRGGYHFRDVGVEQLRVDYQRLTECFQPSNNNNDDDSAAAAAAAARVASFPLLHETLVIFSWDPMELEQLVDVLYSLRGGGREEDEEGGSECTYDEDRETNVEIQQMHDVLMTKGIRVMHPLQVLYVSSLRLQ